MGVGPGGWLTWIDQNLAAPVVTLTGYYPAYEGAQGGFTLTRTGSTSQALTVYVETACTGSNCAYPNGGDYEGFGSATAVTIPAGYSSDTFPITPTDDANPEGTETITLRLREDTGSYRTYVRGAPYVGSILLYDND